MSEPVTCPDCGGDGLVMECGFNCQGHQNDYEVPCGLCGGTGQVHGYQMPTDDQIREDEALVAAEGQGL